MKRIFSIFSIALILLISACSTTKPLKPIAPSVPKLVGTSWKEGAPSKLTLRFRFSPRTNIQSYPDYNSPEGLYFMGGMGGCNGASAGYLQNGWNLKSTGSGGATLMACSPHLMTEDARLAHALENVQSFTIDDRNRLNLLDKNKQRLLVLEPDLNATP